MKTKKKIKIRERRNRRAFTIIHVDGRIEHHGKMKKDGTRKITVSSSPIRWSR